MTQVVKAKLLNLAAVKRALNQADKSAVVAHHQENGKQIRAQAGAVDSVPDVRVRSNDPVKTSPMQHVDAGWSTAPG
jgi:hypothetical protein